MRGSDGVMTGADYLTESETMLAQQRSSHPDHQGIVQDWNKAHRHERHRSGGDKNHRTKQSSTKSRAVNNLMSNELLNSVSSQEHSLDDQEVKYSTRRSSLRVKNNLEDLESNGLIWQGHLGAESSKVKNLAYFSPPH